MACIKIVFPRLAYTTSTWVADEHWTHLSSQQKTALIYRYIKNNHGHALVTSQNESNRRNVPNFRWEEI
jgi:hypothetical protein